MCHCLLYHPRQIIDTGNWAQIFEKDSDFFSPSDFHVGKVNLMDMIRLFFYFLSKLSWVRKSLDELLLGPILLWGGLEVQGREKEFLIRRSTNDGIHSETNLLFFLGSAGLVRLSHYIRGEQHFFHIADNQISNCSELLRFRNPFACKSCHCQGSIKEGLVESPLESVEKGPAIFPDLTAVKTPKRA